VEAELYILLVAVATFINPKGEAELPRRSSDPTEAKSSDFETPDYNLAYKSA